MIYSIKINDKQDNIYDAKITVTNKYLHIDILNGEDVGYLKGVFYENVFKLDIIYVYRNYRNLGLGTELLDILYLFLENKVEAITGTFLPLSLEGEYDLDYIEEKDKIFYKNNYFSVSASLLVRPVMEHESSYEFIDNKIVKVQRGKRHER